MKSAKRSGAGKDDIDHFEKELKKYAFLDWLKPFIRLRQNTATNIIESDESLSEDDNRIQEKVVKPDSDVDSDFSDKESVKSFASSVKSFASTSQAGQTRPRKEKGVKKLAPSKVPASKSFKSSIDETETECLKVITERLVSNSNNQKIEKNEDDLFGEMVAAELKALPKRIKFRLKHEINNAIYKFQAMNMESEMMSYIQPTFNSNSYNGHSGIPTDITTPPGSANAIPNRPMASFQSPLSQSLNLPNNQWDGINK